MKTLSPHALGLLRALDVMESARQRDQAAEELIDMGLAAPNGEKVAITPLGRERAARERLVLAEKASHAKAAARKASKH
jgi:hypothetical protein